MADIAAKLLRELESSDLPISTPQLTWICADGVPNPRGRVWAELTDMEKAGLVRRVRKDPTGSYWVRSKR